MCKKCVPILPSRYFNVEKTTLNKLQRYQKSKQGKNATKPLWDKGL